MSTRELVVFSDAEQDAVDGLNDFLAGRDEDYLQDVVAHVRTPETRPSRLVTVRRAGGKGKLTIATARLAIVCWHETDTQAHDLAFMVRAALYQLKGYRGFRGLNVVGEPLPAPDTDGTPRYLLTVEYTLKGVPA